MGTWEKVREVMEWLDKPMITIRRRTIYFTDEPKRIEVGEAKKMVAKEPTLLIKHNGKYITQR